MLLEAAARGLTDTQIAQALGGDVDGVDQWFATVATRIVAHRGDTSNPLIENTSRAFHVRRPGSAPPAWPAAASPAHPGGRG